MSNPVRTQRRRTKGWRKPEGAVIVSRPSRFGNPCRVGLMQEMGYDDPHAAAAANYETWLRGNRYDAPTDDADQRRARLLPAHAESRDPDPVAHTTYDKATDAHR
ncbi:DUF4326 domain-containing protein, partial [Streptomyces erythrochromogenes]|uniref:DUF4326 domain-containing protein n=1 Tax=Streptomyces erythrochromogenes TaxID=285574 RepID=UPI003694E16B